MSQRGRTATMESTVYVCSKGCTGSEKGVVVQDRTRTNVGGGDLTGWEANSSSNPLITIVFVVADHDSSFDTLVIPFVPSNIYSHDCVKEGCMHRLSPLIVVFVGAACFVPTAIQAEQWCDGVTAPPFRLISGNSYTVSACTSSNTALPKIFLFTPAEGNPTVVENISLRIVAPSFVPFVLFDIATTKIIRNIEISYRNVSVVINASEWDNATTESKPVPALVSVWAPSRWGTTEIVWTNITIHMQNVTVLFVPDERDRHAFDADVKANLRGILRLEPTLSQCHNLSSIDSVSIQLIGCNFTNLTTVLFYAGCLGNDVIGGEHQGVRMSNLSWDFRSSIFVGTMFLGSSATMHWYSSAAAFAALFGAPVLTDTSITIQHCTVKFTLFTNESASWEKGEVNFPMIIVQMVGPPIPIVTNCLIQASNSDLSIDSVRAPIRFDGKSFIYIMVHLSFLTIQSVTISNKTTKLPNPVGAEMHDSRVIVENCSLMMQSTPSKTAVIQVDQELLVKSTVFDIGNTTVNIALSGVASKSITSISGSVVVLPFLMSCNVTVSNARVRISLPSGNIPSQGSGGIVNTAVLDEWRQEYNNSKKSNLTHIGAGIVSIVNLAANSRIKVEECQVIVRVLNAIFYNSSGSLAVPVTIGCLYCAASLVELVNVNGLSWCDVTSTNLSVTMGIVVVPVSDAFGSIIVADTAVIALGNAVLAISVTVSRVSALIH